MASGGFGEPRGEGFGTGTGEGLGERHVWLVGWDGKDSLRSVVGSGRAGE